ERRFDVGDDARGARRERVFLVVGLRVRFWLPISALDVEHEAELLAVLAACPAEVDAPERGGLTVSQPRKDFAVDFDLCGAAREMSSVFAEAYAGDDFVTEPQALLFIGVDLVAAARRDVLHTEERRERRIEWTPAAFAQIHSLALRHLMQVTASVAELGALRQHVAVADGQDDFVDDIFRAFVIDDRARAEFRNRQEPRARNEFVTLLAAARRDEGRNRQAREAVARQKAFAGEVAVAVEVGLRDALHLGQQFDLRFGEAAHALRQFLVLWAARGVTDDAVLRLLFVQ